VGLFAPVRDYIDALIHPLAQQDALTAARHRAFIGPRLLGSSGALAAVPLYLGLRGMPSVLEVIVFSWLLAPILIAYFLSRTGRYESAHILSSLALTGLVTAVAMETGGVGSFAATWLVVVPLEASLSSSRRVVVLASVSALGACWFLLLAGGSEAVTAVEQMPPGLTALGIASAILYATGLALAAESLARTGLWLRGAEEQRYHLLASNMTDVITRHGRNGTVLFASPAAEALFGVPISDLLGYGLFERIHIGDRPAYLMALSDFGASASAEGRSVEFRIRREPVSSHAPPRFVWVEMRCRAVDQTQDRSGSKGERQVVAVIRDVMQRKEQEIALEQAHAETARADAAKTRFLATMSHELRTPLNAIIGFSDMLTKEDDLRIDAKMRHDYAHLINESGQHLLAVVNGILDMSKIEGGHFEITPEPFAPGPIIRDCCDLLALRARESQVDLAVRIFGDLPEIVADRRSFNQIMLNLLSNAIKFSNRGGKVDVAAAQEGDCLVVRVEDAGVGIGADDLPRIGDPFFQSRASYDRRHDGTGLGLSIVKGLVELHGGELEIASRLGEGTCVMIRLPVNCELVSRAPARAAPKGAATRPVEPINFEVKKRA
jgi:cell cycle sensor histidine kinase DivJ